MKPTAECIRHPSPPNMTVCAYFLDTGSKQLLHSYELLKNWAKNVHTAFKLEKEKLHGALKRHLWKRQQFRVREVLKNILFTKEILLLVVLKSHERDL